MTIEATGMTARTMRVDAALAKRLAKDAGRQQIGAVWAGIGLLALVFVGLFALNGNPRSLISGAFWTFIVLAIVIAVRRARVPGLTRAIEAHYPRGAELSAEVSDLAVSMTSPVAQVRIPTRAITRIAVAAHSVRVHVEGLSGPALILPRELVDDEAVATLRAAASRARRR
jgi:hypothetical protein